MKKLSILCALLFLSVMLFAHNQADSHKDEKATKQQQIVKAQSNTLAGKIYKNIFKKMASEMDKAIKQNDYKTVKRILKLAKQNEFTQEQLDQWVLIAAGENHVEIMKELIAYGGKPDFALCYAARAGALDAAEYLVLEEKVDPNEMAFGCGCPVDVAAEKEYTKMVKFLLSHGAVEGC